MHYYFSLITFKSHDHKYTAMQTPSVRLDIGIRYRYTHYNFSHITFKSHDHKYTAMQTPSVRKKFGRVEATKNYTN